MAIRNEILRRRIARVTMLAAAEGDRLARRPSPPRASRRRCQRPAYRLRHRRLCGHGGRHRGDDRLGRLRLSPPPRPSRPGDARAREARARREGRPDERGPGGGPSSAPLARVSAARRLRPARGASVVRLYAGGDPSKLPSALIGQSAPPLTLAGLDGAPGLADADLRPGPRQRRQRVRLLVRAVPLRAPDLMALAADDELKRQGVVVYGVAQKDSAENIRRFLGALATPTPRSGSTPTDAPASTGASTACRRPSSSAATAPSPTSSSARSPPKRSPPTSSRRSSRPSFRPAPDPAGEQMRRREVARLAPGGAAPLGGTGV